MCGQTDSIVDHYIDGYILGFCEVTERGAQSFALRQQRVSDAQRTGRYNPGAILRFHVVAQLPNTALAIAGQYRGKYSLLYTESCIGIGVHYHHVSMLGCGGVIVFPTRSQFGDIAHSEIGHFVTIPVYGGSIEKRTGHLIWHALTLLTPSHGLALGEVSYGLSYTKKDARCTTKVVYSTRLGLGSEVSAEYHGVYVGLGYASSFGRYSLLWESFQGTAGTFCVGAHF